MEINGKYLAMGGLVLQAGHFLGLFGTIAGMSHAFTRLADTSAAETQAALASDMALALYTTAIGIAIAIIGVLPLLIALFGVKYRARWFKTAMWIMAVLWLLSGPLGIVIGIIVMLYLTKHRNEFNEQPTIKPPVAQGQSGS